MRFLSAILTLAAILILAPNASADENETTSGGVLYLTDNALTEEHYRACETVRRYEMATNISEPGEAIPSLGTAPERSCVTRFVYKASSEFQLSGAVNASITVSCKLPTAYVPGPEPLLGGVGLILTNHPMANDNGDQLPALGGDPDRRRLPFDQNPCVSGTATATGQLPSNNMSFAPGDTLTLLAWIYFVNPTPEQIPTVTIITGPTDGSRLENNGLPRPEDEGQAAAEDSRQTYFFGNSDIERVIEDTCNGLVAHGTMKSGPNSSTDYLSSWGRPGSSCATIFVIEPPTPIVLDGRISLNFWFSCSPNVVGDDLRFLVRFYADDEQILGPGNRQIARPINPGETPLASCPTTPTNIFLETHTVDGAALKEGEYISMLVYHFYRTTPTEDLVLNFHSTPTQPSWIALPAAGNQTPEQNSTNEPEPDGKKQISSLPWVVVMMALVVTTILVKRTQK